MKSREKYWSFFIVYLFLPKNTVAFLVPPVPPFEKETDHLPLILDTQVDGDFLTTYDPSFIEKQKKQTEAEMGVANEDETSTARSSEIVKPVGELTADLLRHNIIPDFVDDVPSVVCAVEWAEGDFADLGNLIPTSVVKHPPCWLDWKGKQSEWYTFIMSGLDEPSAKKPNLREYQHWVLVNIPGNHFLDGETLVSYKEPNPAEETGMHRHGIVVYQQPGKLTFKEKPILSPTDDKLRGNFSSIQFAEKYHLGKPVAINFFQTEWPSPPTLPPALHIFRSTSETYTIYSEHPTITYLSTKSSQRTVILIGLKPSMNFQLTGNDWTYYLGKKLMNIYPQSCSSKI